MLQRCSGVKGWGDELKGDVFEPRSPGPDSMLSQLDAGEVGVLSSSINSRMLKEDCFEGVVVEEEEGVECEVPEELILRV